MTDPASAAPRPIASPCTNICRMDDATGWCIGCGRTLAEIARWGGTSDADRDTVMAALPERMATLSRDSGL
ncbi:DUF1289 domain-containing protein [Sphingomonas sp. Root241]|uniref:DUF1289 domain-containing protein n=1 Tax=Sphingomonas sp. Root241 TaxID=1736501 RepID=UPI0006F2BA69|nr:DUF1289 domain-containing protein [Sphingomonas sp. Root241]KRC80250.1 hypothetical protein ASE13_14695 [Sphingomonas sp. Root241]